VAASSRSDSPCDVRERPVDTTRLDGSTLAARSILSHDAKTATSLGRDERTRTSSTTVGTRAGAQSLSAQPCTRRPVKISV
jgi:hypothetical protein